MRPLRGFHPRRGFFIPVKSPWVYYNASCAPRNPNRKSQNRKSQNRKS
jgi:hypothetical protein